MTDDRSLEQKVQSVLDELYVPAGAELWLASPNKGLGGWRPNELIRAGQGERVLTYLKALAEGAYQ